MKSEFIAFAFLMLMLVSPRFTGGFASQELIVNGGFETGDFKGWHADDTCQVKPDDYSSSPAHKGGYSASIGASNPNIEKKGSLSQTVTILEDSRAVISFWYRVEKQCILDFYLRKADGLIIQNWTFHEKPTWTSFVYDLTPHYAGKTIILDFEGKGFLEIVWVPMPIVTDVGVVEHDVPLKKNHYSYVDDVSIIPESAYLNIKVKTSGLPSELLTSVSLDGSSSSKNASAEESASLRIKFGELHNLTVDKYVYESERVRYVCKNNSLTVNASSDSTMTFDYTPQYQLTLESAYGMVRGSGWYDKDEIANFSVSPVVTPAEGFPGLIGVKYAFQGWSGDLRASSESGHINMDSAKKAVAIWAVDYSSSLMIIGGLSVVIVALVLFRVTRKKR